MSVCSLIDGHLVNKGLSVMWVTVRWPAKAKRARRFRDLTHAIPATEEDTCNIAEGKLPTFKAVHHAALAHSLSLIQS